MKDEDDDFICGESIDHDTEVTYEDAEMIQWQCLRCGAEGWEDKQ